MLRPGIGESTDPELPLPAGVSGFAVDAGPPGRGGSKFCGVGGADPPAGAVDPPGSGGSSCWPGLPLCAFDPGFAAGAQGSAVALAGAADEYGVSGFAGVSGLAGVSGFADDSGPLAPAAGSLACETLLGFSPRTMRIGKGFGISAAPP